MSAKLTVGQDVIDAAIGQPGITKHFIGSTIEEDGLYDLFVIAEKAVPKKTNTELLEAAITMIEDDRSLGRDEIRERLGQMRPRHPCDF
jgi:hypothetical protein